MFKKIFKKRWVDFSTNQRLVFVSAIVIPLFIASFYLIRQINIQVNLLSKKVDSFEAEVAKIKSLEVDVVNINRKLKLTANCKNGRSASLGISPDGMQQICE